MGWLIPATMVKGLVMAALILGVAEASFIEALIVAICSAIVNGSFLLVATHFQSRKTQAKVEEVKQVVEQSAEVKNGA